METEGDSFSTLRIPAAMKKKQKKITVWKLSFFFFAHVHSSVGRANRLDEFLVTAPAMTALVFKLCDVVDGGTVVAVSRVGIKTLLNKKGVGVVDG